MQIQLSKIDKLQVSAFQAFFKSAKLGDGVTNEMAFVEAIVESSNEKTEALLKKRPELEFVNWRKLKG